MCNFVYKSVYKITQCVVLHTDCSFTHTVCNFTQNIDSGCFVARQFLSQIYALLSVKFSGLKMCWCKKNDKSQVWGGLYYILTRSSGALWAPTSSLRPFGPPLLRSKKPNFKAEGQNHYNQNWVPQI